MNPHDLAKRMMVRMTALMFSLMALLSPVIVLAQDAAPPQPTLQRSPPVLIGYGIIFVLLVIVVVISFIPSKRGHQD